MSTEVILCRHGEAHVNVLGLVGGEKTCTGLTDAGREQAACLAARLRAEHESAAPFDVLYSAPRRRVQETAGFISPDDFTLTSSLAVPRVRRQCGTVGSRTLRGSPSLHR